PKRFDINHRHKISKASVGCINIPILFLRSFPHSDSIVSHRVLKGARMNFALPNILFVGEYAEPNIAVISGISIGD
ncbi:MAG: hypothetical protein WAU53_10305, partial [Rhodoplanes sp.]